MLTDLRLHWRTYRPFVVAPLLAIVAVSVVVFASTRHDRDGGLTALRTDAPTPSVAVEPEAVAVAAPELITSSADGAVLVVPDVDSNTSTSTLSNGTDGSEQSSTNNQPSTTPPSTTAPSSTRLPTSATDTTLQQTTQASSAEPPPTTEPTTTKATQPRTAETVLQLTEPQMTCQGIDEFELVFRDDFNGSSIGPAWRQYDSVGNNDFGLRHPSANAVANGRLVITARMENGRLVSGGMAHTYDQQYGKYVFRVRTEDDPDMATSGVVLTWPQSQVHPRDGENNIYETLAHTPKRTQFFSVVHKPFGQKGDQEYFIHRANGAAFQTMTMEWRPDGITLIRQGDDPNDREVFEVTETGADLVPDNPHHVTIQLDAWKHQMQGPVQMEVDYIEVHKYCG